ncbi:MAG: CinA family protein [Candidatus Obscuribacterales bacterium]|nr:CinA family protein [Steroidobacteraceae bacterium]
MATEILSVDDAQLAKLAAQVGEHLRASRRRLVTAESCTGGWIGKVLTDVAGSSAWFLGGAVVYSNELKRRTLGVSAATLAQHGAVSQAAVCAMAEGALDQLGGELSVAVSGIAGPDGGTSDKPVGTVWFSWARRGTNAIDTLSERQVFVGDREQVRRQTVLRALQRILQDSLAT